MVVCLQTSSLKQTRCCTVPKFTYLLTYLLLAASRAVCSESENHVGETYITSVCVEETRILSDMCVGKRGSLEICMWGNAILREAHT